MYDPVHPIEDPPANWSPRSWESRPAAQRITYDDPGALHDAVGRLSELPPLVTSWEIERLRARLGDVAAGRRFLLQGGDCAESFGQCDPKVITNKLKILLQMSLVLSQGLKMPVVRVGRFAGQYAKPRSSATETIGGVTLPSYFGDLINGEAFTAEARRPDPGRLVDGYKHAALTLNFIRSLIDGGFADLHHPEYWDVSFLSRGSMPERVRASYSAIRNRIADAIEFFEAVSETKIGDLARVEFYTSHEGLHLDYEAALTRRVPRRAGYYNLGCHLPWIGARTTQPDGAHIEYFRGIRNPVGLKVDGRLGVDGLLRVLETLDPLNEPGRVVLIARFGAGRVAQGLPPLVEAVRRAGRRPVWMCDPMHGNTESATTGRKTRRFDAIMSEVLDSIDLHRAAGSFLGGVHFELTGENVTECVGGASGVTEADLDARYESPCDPRLNYEQAMELSFAIADKMGAGHLP